MEQPTFDFDRAPFLVIWEATRACALACVHCRADAMGLKTTEAPHYRRVTAQRDAETGTSRAREAARLGARQMRAPRAVNDGNGFVFIDHEGAICPSGFLPMPRGNVREGSLVDTYRHDEVFRQLRDADRLEDHCGRCDFRAVCGGSRSRAFAATGNAFAGDPLCNYRI